MQQRKRRPVTRAQKADKSLSFSYKDFGTLQKYLTEQGYIIPRIRTGLAQKQQRQLTRAVKQARHLALLPFTQTL